MSALSLTVEQGQKPDGVRALNELVIVDSQFVIVDGQPFLVVPSEEKQRAETPVRRETEKK